MFFTLIINSLVYKNWFVLKRNLGSNMTKTKFIHGNSFPRFSTYSITQNIAFNTRKPIEFHPKGNSIRELNFEEDSRPMVVLLEYMNAKKKHVNKISDIYLDWGFDVLQICLKPMQLLSPVKGSQVVAKDLADFLAINKSFSPLVIHGFSVGGYLWGETLVHFNKNLELYQSTIDRIKGQIFDSPADFEAIPTAFPYSIFPKNPLCRSMFEAYLRFHLKFNYETATKHYLKSRELFTCGIVKSPTLFITSDSDILSSVASVCNARDELLMHNLEATVKIFNGSQHVMHFKSYPGEYKSEMESFLRKIGLAEYIKIKAKL